MKLFKNLLIIPPFFSEQQSGRNYQSIENYEYFFNRDMFGQNIMWFLCKKPVDARPQTVCFLRVVAPPAGSEETRPFCEPGRGVSPCFNFISKARVVS